MDRVSRGEFSHIVKKGRIVHAPHVFLRVAAASHGRDSAFAFVVSRKVTNMAAKRNLLKRRGRHIVRDAAQKFTQPARGAFFFKKGADTLSFDELKKEITSLLSQ